MFSPRRNARLTAGIALLSSLALLGTACGSGDDGASQETTGVTINVTLGAQPLPQAALDAFRKSTGITAKGTNLDWDSLQTKIAAAATAKTYFADATDVDWSRVGQLGKLRWFYPMENYLDTKALTRDMPQLSSFTTD